MEKQFPQGIFYKPPMPNAPDFVKGSLSIKVDELIPYLQEKSNNGWVNLDMKQSKAGKIYLELNTWKPEAKEEDIKIPDNLF